jgi:hypothetical protein
MLAERGHFQQAEQEWPGHPDAVKLADLDVICVMLGCEAGELLIPEPVPAARPAARPRPARWLQPHRRPWRPAAVMAGRCPPA